MNSIWKRSLAMLLSLVMVFGMLPMSAFAEDGVECAHIYENGVCTLCEAPCGHVYGEPVVTEATCGQDGVAVYTCTVEGCGKVTEEVLPATGEHVYDETTGVCTVCNYAPVMMLGDELEQNSESNTLEIGTAAELFAFAEDVNVNGNNYKDKTVVLTADINLNDALWTPIGANADAVNSNFCGTFDGQNHTISNLFVDQNAAYHSAGLFGATTGTIKNLIIDGAWVESLSSGSATTNGTAVVAGSTAYGATIENVHVKDAVVKGNRYVAGIVGYMDGTVTGCSVEDLYVTATPDDLTGSYDNGDKVGGIVGYCNSGAVEISDCELKGIVSLTAYRDVAGIVGCANSSVDVNNNTNSAALTVTVDQVTNFYGEKAANAGEFIGRDAPADATGNITAEGATYTTVVAEEKPEISGTFNGALINMENAERTFISAELKNVYATESVVLKLYDANDELLATTSLVDHGDILSVEFGTLSMMIGINCTDSYWNTEWEILSADHAPAYGVLYIDGTEMNTKEINMATTSGEAAVNWADVPGVPAASTNKTWEVATLAELTSAIANAAEDDTILLTADINCSTTQLTIEKAIILDLGDHTLTTANNWGGMILKGNPAVKNGKIVHTGNTAAIKAWNVASFEDLVIEVSVYTEGKDKGGIVIQNETTVCVGSIKNVTIQGAGLTNGIETYNCGDATQNVIGSMENVTINAKRNGMLISAPCGTATNCTITGGTNGIEIWIKGTYSATLDLVNSTVNGGVYAHDEFNSDPSIVNNGTLSLTADENTNVGDVTVTIARAENVEGTLKEVMDEAAVKLGDTYYSTLDAAFAAAKAAGMTEVEITVLDDIKFSTAVNDFAKVTFTGTNREQTVDMNVNAVVDVDTELVFNDLTVSRLDAAWLNHWTYIRGGLTYNDCKMIGLFNVTAQDTDFIGCDFYNDDTFGDGNYSLWLYNCYDGVEVNVTDCTFNVYERAIKMYGDGYKDAMTLNISGTTLTSRTADKTVVEMAYDNGTGTGVMNLNITKSTATGFGAPEHIEGEANAWFNVEGNNSNSVVKLDSVQVWPVEEGLKGSGTQEDPYLINNLEDLKWFRDSVNTYTSDRSNQYVGKYVKLTADIDLAGENWTPIGTNSVGDHMAFMGTFYGEKADGTVPTISNLSISANGSNLGFFARAGSYDETEKAVVKNLNFNNVTVKSTDNGTHIGGVIGNSGSNITVEGITVTGNVEISGRAYVGGIVGHGYPKIDNCQVEATGSISASYWCSGAIVGYGGEGGTRVTNSSVTGTGTGLTINTVAGGAAAVVGLSVSSNYFENVSAVNVDIIADATGTSYNPDYCLGYVIGNGEERCTLKNITATDVTVKAVGKDTFTSTDAVATVGNVAYFDLQSALNAAAAGTGNVTVEILRDIDLTNVDWNPVTVSGPGYPLVTVNGNEKTITGLNDMLFAGTWAGNSGLIINDLTIKDSTIVNDENDAMGNVGVGAFIGYPQASATITLNNCHLVDSTVKGGHWTGGLIGMAGGYNGDDGPVFMNLTIENCSVTGSTITGKGSAGGVIGHGSCAAWTNVVIENTTVSGNTISSTGTYSNKAGSVMGTIGAAGQPTTADGETKTGGAFVEATVSGNIVTSNGTAISTIYGRQGTETGVLTLTGGSYDSYPIEQNVSYAAPKEGYEITGTNGTYTLTPELPSAKVTPLKKDDLTFALTFETVEADPEQMAYYGDWYADFVLTVNKPVTFNADGSADGWLSGQYDNNSDDWVNVPFESVTLAAGESMRIMKYAAEKFGPDFKLTYQLVYDYVKTFNCGVFFDEEYLAANPDLKVTLQLKLYENYEDTEGFVIGDTYTFTLPAPELPTATVTPLKNEDLTFALTFEADEVTQPQLNYYGDWYADYVLTVNKTVTFNADGTEDGWLSGQYNGWEEEGYDSADWLNVPFDSVTVNANESMKIMEYAAISMNKPGLKVTYSDVYNYVKLFNCGVYFEPEFLAANPDLEVKLELRMYNPKDESESYTIGETYVFTLKEFVAFNMQTETFYTDVSDALDEAEANHTVFLLRDATDNRVAVYEETTFDLNGYKLTASYMTSYGTIIDSSEDNAGRLAVNKSRFLLQKDNAQLPVNTAEDGYAFVEVLGFNEAYQPQLTRYVFQPLFEEAARELLLAGGEVTGVSINARVSWTSKDGKRSQGFVFNDNLLKSFLNSYNSSTGKYDTMFTLTLRGIEGLQNLDMEAVVLSDLPVEFVPDEVVAGGDNATGDETGNVKTNENDQVAEKVSLKNENATAEVPSGTQLKAGTTNLTLNVSEVEKSATNITLGTNEVQKSVDVHIEGVSVDNEVPMIITLNKFAPEGLNQGNLALYHVENGETVTMAQVSTLADVDAHNEFYYDPATGDVTMALATFSEVAVVVNTENAWKGEFDYSWYTSAVTLADTEEATEYTIANADQLAGFGAIVGGMNGQTQDSFAGKTVKLIADINLGDNEDKNNPDVIFYPIGYYNNSKDGSYEKVSGGSVISGFNTFEGTFDGQGHTISNFYQNTWEMFGDYNDGYSGTPNHYRDGMGLFGKVYGGTVKNLTVSNFSSDGEFTTTGVIAAYADSKSGSPATFENIAIVYCNPRVYNIGNGGIVGCGGWYSKDTTVENAPITFKNITVDNSNKISALWGSWDVACGGLMGQYYPNSGCGVSFNNCHVSAQIDVYNDVCANYQYYAYRYAGMMIGSIRENETIDGHVYPKMNGITASDCTVNFGTWNDYYYCELVANSLASYTHDHQMSRLEQVNSVDVENMKVTSLKGVTTDIPAGRVNYVVVEGEHATEHATCYHFVDGKQHSHSDYNGDGTDDYETVDTDGDGVAETVLVEDKQHIYREFNQLFTGYGWGVTSKGLSDFKGIDVDGIEIEEGEQQESVEKFESKYTNKGYTYRVGNAEGSTVSAGLLFEAKKGAVINNSGVYVSITSLNDEEIMGTYTAPAEGTSWTEGQIQFKKTGLVKVTIQDYTFCKPTELYLEVVEGVNAISATNATSNNVVLLKDCDFSSLEVSGGYTLYGNGFTMTCSTDSAAIGFGEFVKLNDGTLDNVQIICPNYDYAALYNSQLKSTDNRSETANGTKRYYNAKSAVVATGNSQILNSYISGGRAALYASNGNIVADNSRFEGGAVATVIITAANSMVFRDVTLTQKPTPSTYDSNKTMLGLSVLYLCNSDGNATPTKLEGSFVQNAWADSSCTAYLPAGTDSIATTVLGKTDYQHEVNGKTSVNLGFAYMPSDGTKVNQPSNITDSRTNKETQPYAYESVSAKASGVTVSTYVYSYKNTNGTDDSFVNDQVYTPDTYSDIIVVSYEDATDGITTGKSYGTNGWEFEVNVDLDKLSGYELDFSKLSMSVNGVVVEEYKVDGNTKPASPVSVTTGAKTYTLTTTVNNETYAATLVVTGMETSKDKPYLSDANGNEITEDQVSWGAGKCVTRKASLVETNYTGAAPVLEGINIRYWSVNENRYVILNLASITPNDSQALNGKERFWEFSEPNGDYTLKITNTAVVHSQNTVYAMPVSYKNTMYFVASSADGFVSTGSGAREIKIQYDFKDNNGGELTFNHTWTVAYNKSDALSYSEMTGIKDNNSCVTGDTLVTLADGTQKEIQYVTPGEEVVVWNFHTGAYEVQPLTLAQVDDEGEMNVLHLYFEDGTELKVLGEHGIFDADQKTFIFIDQNDVEEYVGHNFVKQSGNGYETVKLVDYKVTTEEIKAYTVLSAYHYNVMLENMWTVTPAHVGDNFFNPFEIGEGMKYDEAQVQADIEKYGLYTYEDFAHVLTEEQFELLNIAQFKVSVGKGLVTYEGLIYLIENFINR